MVKCTVSFVDLPITKTLASCNERQKGSSGGVFLTCGILSSLLTCEAHNKLMFKRQQQQQQGLYLNKVKMSVWHSI